MPYEGILKSKLMKNNMWVLVIALLGLWVLEQIVLFHSTELSS